MIKTYSKWFIGASLVFMGCTQEVSHESPNFDFVAEYHQAQQLLTDVMVHDIFSPPLASRSYSYASLSSYYLMQESMSDSLDLFARLNGFQKESLITNQEANIELAAVLAYYQSAENLVFTNDSLIKYKKVFLKKVADAGFDDDLIKASIALANKASKLVLSYADADGYAEIRSNKGYILSEHKAAWRPTPPSYMEPILPSWNKIRPFVLDSASQFKPVPPPEVSLEEGTKFYEDLMQVYELSKVLTAEQKEIAGFWDCNPFVVEEKGHLMIGLKKISPGGHWMGITKMVLEKENADLLEASRTYSLVSVTLADAFISCWDEKYRSNYIRPVTIINRDLDPNWKPLLQTPPFPEYTSGHSVISTATAIMLTELFGEQYAFTDSVEIAYGLNARSFSSFRNASDEAAVSRLYGGIHYMPAIAEGVTQGEGVANYLIQELFE